MSDEGRKLYQAILQRFKENAEPLLLWALIFIVIALIIYAGWYQQVGLFIGAHTSLISLLFSFVVTGSTVVYAYLTSQLLKETKFLRQQETEPYIAVYLTSDSGTPWIINIVVENTGRAAARTLRWEFLDGPEEVAEWLRRSDALILPSVAIFRDGIAYLAPGQRITSMFGSSFSLLGESGLPPVTLRVTYEYANELTGQALFVLTAQEFAGLSWVADATLENSLERIAKRFEEITQSRSHTPFYALHTVTETSPEVRRQVEAQHEEFIRRERPDQGKADVNQSKKGVRRLTDAWRRRHKNRAG